MPKRSISFIAGHHYHVFNRSINRDTIFYSPENYHYCLGLLRKNSERYRVTVIAFCLLPNHYHFLLKPTVDETISAFMKSIFGSYTLAINMQQNRRGPLFENRFRAVLVDREDYLIHLMRYIHLNPVDAGLVIRAEEWPYSNYIDVVYQRKGAQGDSAAILEYFKSGDAYRLFVEDYMPNKEAIANLQRYTLE